MMFCDLSSTASAAFSLSWWALVPHVWASRSPRQILEGLLIQLRHLWQSFRAYWLIFTHCFLRRFKSSSTWRTSPWMNLRKSSVPAAHHFVSRRAFPPFGWSSHLCFVPQETHLDQYGRSASSSFWRRCLCWSSGGLAPPVGIPFRHSSS